MHHCRATAAATAAVQAIRHGDMILVDELNLAEDAVLERLNRCARGCRSAACASFIVPMLPGWGAVTPFYPCSRDAYLCRFPATACWSRGAA